MGFSYPVLQHGVAHEVRSSGFGVGLIQAANISGCVLGAMVVGLARLQDPGSSTTLRDLSIIGVGFSLAAVFTSRRSSRIFSAAIAATVMIASLTFCFPHRDRLWLRLHGRVDVDTLVAEDLTGVAALIPEGGGRYRMSTNGKGQSLIPFGGIHSKLGALPATLHPRPERIAIIGLGSGDTAWAAACRAETTEILVFEVSSGQLPLLRRFSERSRFPALESFLNDRRVAVVTADGRTEIARDATGFDLIEADAVRPNGAYSGNLYSVEFFRICASKLRPKGLMCSWAPTPRTRRTFLHVFPHVVELDGGVVLIGSNDPIDLDRDAWNARLRAASTAAYLGPEVLAECLGGLATARVASRNGRVEIDLNTDLDSRDEYLVPPR
jgi:spermidine synthase